MRLRSTRWIPWSGLAALLVPAMALAESYWGSERCGFCHPEQYERFLESGHPWALQSPDHARERGLPVPDGYAWIDVWRVVGGINWKARYLDQEGYFITRTGPGHDVEGQNQWNLSSGWVDYHGGEVKAYDCGRCHTTGYSPEGHQDGKPGVVGTWELDGIQCERCHGAGRMDVDRSAAACGECHSRGNDLGVVPAGDGFIRSRAQYQELLASPHQEQNCVTCHDPHAKASRSVVRRCVDCHADKSPDAVSSILGSVLMTPAAQMRAAGVTCEDCHMPQATRSAETDGPHRADVKTHLFRIETDVDYFTVPVGASVAGGAIDVGFACLDCHRDRDRDWAAEKARGMHRPLAFLE